VVDGDHGDLLVVDSIDHDIGKPTHAGQSQVLKDLLE
jgi:hypothetical protein